MTLVLLDTNAYLRLAKRIRPILGVAFGRKGYVLTVLEDVQDEVRRSRVLRERFPWFDDEDFGLERDAARMRLTAVEQRALVNAQSVLHRHVLTDLGRYATGGRSPPSQVDCRMLAFGQVRSAIVVTDDLGMHLLAVDFAIDVWHGWELLAKLRSARLVDNALVRDIFDALERNGDLTQSWKEARHTRFHRLFGKRPV